MKYTPQDSFSHVPGGHFEFFFSILRKMLKLVNRPSADGFGLSVQKSFRVNEKTYFVLKEHGRFLSFPDYQAGSSRRKTVLTCRSLYLDRSFIQFLPSSPTCFVQTGLKNTPVLTTLLTCPCSSVGHLSFTPYD